MVKKSSIDYEAARERICQAFCDGMVGRYGVRHMMKKEVEVEKRGKLFWKKGAIVVNQKTGKTRRMRGKFQRKPSTVVKTVIEYPQGVVPEEMHQFAEGMADAFLEVLKIAEENDLVLGGHS